MMIKTIFLAMTLGVMTITPSLAEGDAKAGKKVFKKCAACHTVKEGKHKSGPSLYKIIGSPSGQAEGFTRYSDAMLAAGLTWDEETFRSFMVKPKELIPGTSMAFRGLKKEKDVDNLIAYLISAAEK